MKNKHLKWGLAVFFFVLLLIGISIVIVPEIEHIKRDIEINRTLEEWKRLTIKNTLSLEVDAGTDLPSIYPELYAEMQKYNERIYKDGQKDLVDAWSYQSQMFDLTEYGVPDNIAGCIHIPAIDVEMPLYLGANEQNLSKGFAQLSQTSMPIGGESTNCVVACHRGYNRSAFLKEADKLKVGDTVILENLWATLTYQICQEPIIVEPHETEHILIQPGRDLLTIITCTPYGVGSHRLIFFCERITDTP